MRGVPLDLVGDRFGRLIVLSKAEPTRLGASRWLCRCDCGNEKVTRGGSLTMGCSVSCGCYRIEKAVQKIASVCKRIVKHGCATRVGKSKEYRAWDNFRHRYDGVTADFSRFLSLVGPAPDASARLRHSEGTFQWTT